jgi:hypothetical protein
MEMVWPVPEGIDDGEDEVDQQSRQEKEVEGRVEAGVVLVILWFRHGAGPFGGSTLRLKRITENAEGKGETQRLRLPDS